MRQRQPKSINHATVCANPLGRNLGLWSRILRTAVVALSVCTYQCRYLWLNHEPLHAYEHPDTITTSGQTTMHNNHAACAGMPHDKLLLLLGTEVQETTAGAAAAACAATSLLLTSSASCFVSIRKPRSLLSQEIFSTLRQSCARK